MNLRKKRRLPIVVPWDANLVLDNENFMHQCGAEGMQAWISQRDFIRDFLIENGSGAPGSWTGDKLRSTLTGTIYRLSRDETNLPEIEDESHDLDGDRKIYDLETRATVFNKEFSSLFHPGNERVSLTLENESEAKLGMILVEVQKVRSNVIAGFFCVCNSRIW